MNYPGLLKMKDSCNEYSESKSKLTPIAKVAPELKQNPDHKAEITKTCAVLGCEDFKNLDEESFFRFPEDLHLRQIWTDLTGRNNWTPTDYSYICIRHFSVDCFTVVDDNLVMIEKSVPSMKLPRHVLEVEYIDDETFDNEGEEEDMDIDETCQSNMESALEHDENEYDVQLNGIITQESESENYSNQNKNSSLIEIDAEDNNIIQINDSETGVQIPDDKILDIKENLPVKDIVFSNIIQDVNDYSANNEASKLLETNENNGHLSVNNNSIESKSNIECERAQNKDENKLDKIELLKLFTEVQRMQRQVSGLKEKLRSSVKVHNRQTRKVQRLEELIEIKKNLLTQKRKKKSRLLLSIQDKVKEDGNGLVLAMPTKQTDDLKNFALNIYKYSPQSYIYIRNTLRTMLPTTDILEGWLTSGFHPKNLLSNKNLVKIIAEQTSTELSCKVTLE